MGGFGQLFPAGATILPPLDLPYLAGYLAAENVGVSVLECLGLGMGTEDLTRRVAAMADETSGRALVAMRTSAPSLDWDLSVGTALKIASPHIGLAVYGPVVPHVRARLAREGSLDYIVSGEPDATVHELAIGRPQEEILGLSHRRDGAWFDAPPRPFLKELDRLPFPKWELLPYQRYTLPKSSATEPVPFLAMLTSRGCPFGCHYCPYPVGQGLPWRFRSPKNVVDEIEHLSNDLGIRYILFRDPMFSLRKDRAVEICNEIQRRRLVFRWKCETRPDCMDEATARAMAAAGCDGINFGVESAEVGIQKNVGRKPIAQEAIVEMVETCRKVGIKTFCFFIVGLPGDTVHTVLSTIAFAIRLRPNWVQFTAASPFIGTKLRGWAIEQGLAREDDYSYISSHQAIMGNENLTQEQVARLLQFAQFFERYLINRGGILKDANRKDALYGTARAAADRISNLSARTILSLGRRHLERACATAP
jgi:hypothetical protein